MILTTEQGKNGKIRLIADGEYVASLESSFWYSQGIYDGDEIDGGSLNAILAEAECRRALHSAMSVLSRRPHSEKELFDKLRQKEFSRDACEYAISRAAELKLLDDEGYAERLAKTLIERKGYSLSRVRDELSHKGIDREIIENTVEKLDNDPIMCIIELLNTRFSGFAEDEKARNRAVNSLLRLGYNINDIKSAIREISTY